MFCATYPEAYPSVEVYADMLATQGTLRGLIGPREVPRLWDRHLLNCAVVAQLLAPNCTVCDLGSGAGLPGIVLALVRPDVRVTLLEPLLRRALFLQEVVAELSLAGAVVHRARAEDLHGRSEFDVVTARAVAPLGRLAKWALPLCRPGGELLAMKGSSASTEVADAASGIGKLGGSTPVIMHLGGELLVSQVTVVGVRKGH
ncbi:MAG: 16S rRNA (guanine(527)-N(7))-methyltransferase RsmG [Actinomycetota bacterium]|nr:16S rRNA (guanine(527)-N(7))-methyltransferase RsmG [Actinomycetota bacterium]